MVLATVSGQETWVLTSKKLSTSYSIVSRETQRENKFPQKEPRDRETLFSSRGRKNY